MSHLHSFPSPACSATLCERNSKLMAQSSSVVLDYKKISLKEEESCHMRNLVPSNIISEVYLNEQETIWDKVKQKWTINGFAGIAEVLKDIDKAPSHVRKVLIKLHHCFAALNAWKNSVMKNEVIMETTQKTILECHPHIGRIAVVFKENGVKLLNLSRVSETDQVVLKDRRMSRITCLKWRPHSAMDIAAGSTGGIMVWFLEPNSTGTKPGSHMARYLTASDMTSDVLSIGWCPDGILLACSCKGSRLFWVWNILFQSSTPIQRYGSSVTFVDWSPCKRRLLAANNTSTFRIWETKTWSCETWADLNGKCTNACWSSCGSYLLFSVANEPVIYYIHFYTNKQNENIDIGGSGKALKCADVSKATFSIDDQEIIIGGSISGMAWDPTDSRLAVMFHSEESEQSNIALYHTRKAPTLQLIPCGFVRGDQGEIPLAINFVRGFDKGALLSVYWSSDEISVVPLLFNKMLSSISPANSPVSQVDTISQDNSTLYSLLH